MVGNLRSHGQLQQARRFDMNYAPPTLVQVAMSQLCLNGRAAEPKGVRQLEEPAGERTKNRGNVWGRRRELSGLT